MFQEEVARRWRAGVAWLRHSTERSPRLTPWGWAADAILALTLTIGAVDGASRRQDVQFYVPRPGGIDGGLRMPFPGPEAPLPSDAPLPPDAPHVFMAPAPVTGLQLTLAALTALPLVIRRRFPLTSFWIIAIAVPQTVQRSATLTAWTLLAAVIAAYSAPTYSRYRNLALVSVVAAAVLIIAGSGGDLPNLPSDLVTFVLLASVGLAANVIHTWRQRAQTLRREQAVATELALEHERARLARELHDVVGHNVSVMVIQAGAARKILDTDPEVAREALLAVEAGGRAAMTELRQVIGLLTVDNDDADLAPQPGLSQLDHMVARVRETGVPVTLTVTGTFESLPAGVELAAYRVVQEALTNAVKHAAGAEVAITVNGSPEELRVEVVDTGGTPSTAEAGGGRGLLGLRERLSTYGGTLTTGRRPTGGFRVVAVTPLRAEL